MRRLMELPITSINQPKTNLTGRSATDKSRRGLAVLVEAILTTPAPSHPRVARSARGANEHADNLC